MQPEHQIALNELRAEQARFRGWMQNMDERIRGLADLLEREASVASTAQLDPVPAAKTSIPAASPTPLPPIAPATPTPTPTPADPEPVALAPMSFPRRESPVTPTTEVPEEAAAKSIEIAFGRVWLVRLGVVILLTGLVFLGNLAYQQIIPRLGPAAKLSIIYLAGFTLGGLGMALERKRESMRNYARVVLAGGCATIYYATYAAHFVAPLRVIESPLIGGTLLLGLAVAIGVAAHRRKSETVALVALVLSYYTSGLNPIGGFTLFSSFLLAGTAFYFLLRHRWVRLTIASLAGTYLSYLWCRFHGGGGVVPGAGVLVPLAFLAGYWVLFTAGGFLAGRETLSGAARAQLLTTNNGAFAALSGMELAALAPADAWAFSLGFGILLLVLARVARRFLPDADLVDGALCVQGFALTTLGLALKLTGQQMALAMAAQSVLLLAGPGRVPLLRLCASLLSGAGAAALAGLGLLNAIDHAPGVAGFVAVALVASSWLFRGRMEVGHDRVTPIGFAFVIPALVLAVGAGWRSAGLPQMAGWMALGAILSAVLPGKYRLRELTFAGQALLPGAAAIWLSSRVGLPAGPWLEPLFVTLGGISVSLWWQRQSRLPVSAASRALLEAIPAFCGAMVAAVWTLLTFEGPPEMIAIAVLGAMWIALAVAARARFLSVAGFVFTFLSCMQFLVDLNHVPWAVALLPIAHVLFIAGIATFSARFGPETAKLRQSIANIALALASVMAARWTFVHIPREWHALFFAGIGAALTLTGALTRKQALSITGAALGAFAWLLAVAVYGCAPTWQHLVTVALLPAASRVGRALWSEEPTQSVAPYLTWASMTGLTVWTLRWCDLHLHSISLTIIWTLLALFFFSAGLVLRDRHYRLGGLGLLAASVGRVFFVDVWTFDPVVRILSFVILGLVLMVVGYCYNRFEEKLRQWV